MSDHDPSDIFSPGPYRTPPVEPATDPLTIPYAGQARMRLEIAGGLAGARIWVDPDAVALIRVDAGGGPAPRLRADGNGVRLSWAPSFGEWIRLVFAGLRAAPEIVLHPAVEWSLAIRGGLSDVRVDLAAGRIGGIDIAGGCSDVELALPAPARLSAIRIAGGASDVRLCRPAEIAVSVAIAGGASALRLDDQTFAAIGGPARLHGAGFTPGAPRYELAVAGGASHLAIAGA